MFHLPDKEKKEGREQERKRMARKMRERKKKKLASRNFTNKKSPKNNNPNMTQLIYDTN